MPIKRRWWATIDLLLAQQADTGEGRSSHATRRAFLPLPVELNLTSLPQVASGTQQPDRASEHADRQSLSGATIWTWCYPGILSYILLPESRPLSLTSTGCGHHTGKRWSLRKLMMSKCVGPELERWFSSKEHFLFSQGP